MLLLTDLGATMKYAMANLVILCCALMHTSLLGSDFEIFYVVTRNAVAIFLSCKGASFLLYPLLGWMADVCFTRYKFILVSFITMMLGSVMMLITAALILGFPQQQYSFYSLVAMCIFVGLIGIGLFESTAIQFGMDQMLEASSDELSTFIHWYYWSNNLAQLLQLYTMYFMIFYYHQCNMKVDLSQINGNTSTIGYQVTIACSLGIVSGILQLMCACAGLCVIICYKRQLNIDRTGEHSLKLIYQVLKYAWNHKCPENRSAFTYWEEDIPPRIDLGKNKYGGPFTAEEVEDTKTFFRIILLFFSLLGFHFSGHGYSLIDQLSRWQCPSFWVGIFLADTIHTVLITVIIGVPVYQLVIVQCCPKYPPNMLKRIGLGLLCCVVKGVVEIVIQATATQGEACRQIDSNPLVSCFFASSIVNINGTCSVTSEYVSYCNENNTPFLLMIIPNVLEGVAFQMVFMTTLEFICAQAPLRLKGLLIGIWYTLIAVYYVPVGISELFITDKITWEVFHEVKVFLVFLLFILYLRLSEWYRYRLRDDVVNVQFLVEEIYDKELAQAEEYEREKKGLLGDTCSLSYKTLS